jgi:hypothetical protein
MSIPSGRAASSLKAVLVLAGASLILSACGTDRDNPDGLDPAFLTPVAAAEEAGVAVYWLGPSFEADGVVFSTTEAKFPEGIQGVPVNGLEVCYSPGDQPGGLLYLELFPKSEWTAVEEKVRNPRIPGVTTKTVTVAGRQGELLFLPFGTRPVNALWLIVDFGDVVVLGEALAGGAAYPGGPDYNPFINDPDLLVALMEDLRPYPE